MPNYAEPHTPEWFIALERQNPAQALMTKGWCRQRAASTCAAYAATIPPPFVS